MISSKTKNMQKVGAAVELSLKTFATMNFILSIWLQGALNSILSLIQNLAIVVHFPLLNIMMPANIQIINAFLVPIITFEILDSTLTTKLIYQFDMVKQIILQQTLPEQFGDFGYETHNSLINVGSTFMFIVVYGVMILVLIVFKRLRKIYGSDSICGKLFTFMKKKLIYSFIIQVFISAFMELLIAVYLNLKVQIFSENGEVIGVIFSYLSLVVILGVLPMVYLWVVRRPKHELEHPSFRERWGKFYAQSRLTSRWNLYINFVSLIRRFQFIVFVLYVHEPSF